MVSNTNSPTLTAQAGARVLLRGRVRRLGRAPRRRGVLRARGAWACLLERRRLLPRRGRRGLRAVRQVGVLHGRPPVIVDGAPNVSDMLRV